jgi:superfamily II DNA or RNA helicase
VDNILHGEVLTRMSTRPPISHQILINWAGQRVFQDAQSLSGRGLVQDVAYEPPFVTGTILWSNRPLKTAVRILQNGTAENHCPCRDSKERGIICAHVVALCVELIRRQNNPQIEARRQEELRRAAHIQNMDEGAYLKRARTGAPGSVSAGIRLTLGAGWRAGLAAGHVPLSCAVVIGNETIAIDQIAAGTCIGLSQKDEAILFVLEDIAGGPAPAHLSLKQEEFASLLYLLQGLPLHEEGAAAPLTVAAAKLVSYLHLDLDRDNGELILMLHTEVPFLKPSEHPLYLVVGRHGWVFGAGHFWPLEQILPDPVRSIYAAPVIIAREAVPRFLQTELPVLTGFMRLESDLSPDLFTIEPAAPRFRLLVRGSPASLAATLNAEYNGIALVAARNDPAGQFALPDPADLMRYLVRNLPAEKAALETLAPYGLSGAAGDELTPIVGCREVLNFLGSHVPALRRLGWRVQLEGRIGGFMESMDFAMPVVRINYPDDQPGWFEVGFDFEDAQGQRLTPAEIQRAILKGDSYIERESQRILLDSQAIDAMMEVFRDCSSGEGAEPGVFRMPAVYAAYVKASLDALDGVDVEAPPAWRAKAEQQARLLPIEPVPLPETLDHTLRPYQKEGVNWLRFLEANTFGGILADEMGLGKTLQALAWLQMERHHPVVRGRPALIVCPTSLVTNWAEEAQRFVPHLRVLPLSGSERHARFAEIPQADVVVTSYALLRRDVARYLDHEFSVVVLDEAQHIKNRSTQNAIVAKELRACHKLVLTGTPIENSVSDLWSIMDFLMPHYLGAHESFRRNCELPIAGGGPEAEAAQIRLRRKLQPFLLRRLKLDVAKDLPPRIERVASCALSPDQKAVYKQLLDASRTRLTDLVAKQGLQRSRMEVLKTLLRLRQVCCHLDLLRMEGLQTDAPSAKMELFFELLDQALDGGHRVLVFSQFVSMLTILRKELEQRQIAYCYLDGATQDRMSVVHKFNTDRKIPLFLISLKAGGTGLNLTGADMVIHYDPWWNPAVENQATDRAHRIGQKRTVYSVKLITQGTVEEKVLALQRQKKAVIDATLVSGESVLNAMTWEDIQELLTL